MKEDILGPKVENVELALVELPIEGGDPEYVVFLINNRDDIMEGIIVASTGYGTDSQTGEKIQTSTTTRLDATMELVMRLRGTPRAVPSNTFKVTKIKTKRVYTQLLISIAQ